MVSHDIVQQAGIEPAESQQIRGIFKVLNENPGLCYNHAQKEFRLQVYSLYAFIIFL
jgi:hypothetical protein